MQNIEHKNISTKVIFYLVRHGKTMFNTAGRVQGWSDSPLTEEGKAVVKKLGRGLKEINFVKAYSSDSGRARETAKTILQEKGQMLDLVDFKGLREIGFGKYEGDLDSNAFRDAAEILGYSSGKDLEEDVHKVGRNKLAEVFVKLDNTNTAETYDSVETRMKDTLMKIGREVSQNGGGDVLVVSHGISIGIFAGYVNKEPLESSLQNASVTKVIFSDGEFILESYGDTSYLEV